MLQRWIKEMKDRLPADLSKPIDMTYFVPKYALKQKEGTPLNEAEMKYLLRTGDYRDFGFRHWPDGKLVTCCGGSQYVRDYFTHCINYHHMSLEDTLSMLKRDLNQLKQ
jgi:hypothetical protein